MSEVGRFGCVFFFRTGCSQLPLGSCTCWPEAQRALVPTALHGCIMVFSVTKNLRQSLPAAGIIEESESARGERGRVGQGRVGFRV